MLQQFFLSFYFHYVCNLTVKLLRNQILDTTNRFLTKSLFLAVFKVLRHVAYSKLSNSKKCAFFCPPYLSLASQSSFGINYFVCDNLIHTEKSIRNSIGHCFHYLDLYKQIHIDTRHVCVCVCDMPPQGPLVHKGDWGDALLLMYS